MKALWVPAGSFVVAIALSLLGGPPSRSFARQASDSTGSCRHEGTKVLGLSGTVETVDGTMSPLRAPLIKDFEPSTTSTGKLQHVAKDQDASVCVKTALPFWKAQNAYAGELLDTAGDPQSASMTWVRAEGTTCCHGIAIKANGLFRGYLEVGEPHPGTSGRAQIGRPETDVPVEYTTFSRYDQNCNDVPDSRREVFRVIADLNLDRERHSKPTGYVLVGFMESRVTDIVDNTGIEMLPVRVVITQQGKTRGKGFRRALDREYGFTLSKAFDRESKTEVSVSRIRTQVFNYRTEFVFPLPHVQAGASFYTTNLSNLDTNEHKLLDIPKTAK